MIEIVRLRSIWQQPSRKPLLNGKSLRINTIRRYARKLRSSAPRHWPILAGEITDNDFRPFRLKHGIYGQRQAGVQMVRCKIPGGLLTSVSSTSSARRRRIRRRPRPPHHPPEHAVSFRAAYSRPRSHAPAGRCRPDQSRSLLQHRPQRHHVRLDRHRARRSLRCAPLRATARLRLPPQRAHRNLPRKFKIAFDGCSHQDCIQGTINDVGIRAVMRDGKRGFRMIVGGGLGPLPIEAQLFDEFIPEDRLVNWCEAVIRVFNKYGNRKNKNTARIKFLMRYRGIAWMKEQIEKEYDDIVANGGIEWPEIVPEGFGGYQSNPQPLGNGALLPVVNQPASGDTAYDAWLETNVIEQTPDRLRRCHRQSGSGQPHRRSVARHRQPRLHRGRRPVRTVIRPESGADLRSARTPAAGVRRTAGIRPRRWVRADRSKTWSPAPAPTPAILAHQNHEPRRGTAGGSP